MSKGIPGVGLSQTLSLVGFLFVAVVLSILGYRLTPPGGPPTVRARLLQRTAPVREVQPANLVLITIDGLRTDRIGAYNPSSPSLTRHIDALGRDGFRFEQVVSASPSSFPAHAALMSGLPPSITGALSPVAGRLQDTHRTLAEALSGSGLRTAAFVGSGAVARSSGLARGFGTFDAPRPAQLPASVRAFRRRPAAEVIDGARAWVDDNFRTRFFLWVQLADLLGPHRPPASYRRMHADPYEAAIVYVDAELGRLLDRLESLGVLGRTIVVISASHGLGLGEHGERESGALLYDSTIVVPMLMRVPQEPARDRSIPEQVRSIDMMPTFFELLDIEPRIPLAGASLVPLLDPRGRLPALPAVVTTGYQETFLGGAQLEALRSRGFKLVDGLTPELYDLRRDPQERRNLASSQPERVEEMRRILGEMTGKELLGGARRPPPDPLNLDLLEKGLLALRDGQGKPAHDALARLAARIAADGERDAMQASPALLALRGASLRLMGRHSEALELYREGLNVLRGSTRDPSERTLEGLLQAELAACLHEIDQPRVAITEYRRALELIPEDSDVRGALAGLLLDRGALTEAITEYRAALARTPGAPDLLAGLGRAFLESGDALAAAQSLQRAVQSPATGALPYLDLARASEALSRPGDAARAYRDYLARADSSDVQERRVAEERLEQLEKITGAVP